MLKCPPNTYWVLPHKFLAGEYPGDENEHEASTKLKMLIDCGVTCFIDLTQPGELKPYEHLLPQTKLVVYKRFPITDIGVPGLNSQMVNILDTIDKAVQRGDVVYLHCRGGIGRTGTVVGCYFARRGFTGEKALIELKLVWSRCQKSKWTESPETACQRAYIRQWEE